MEFHSHSIYVVILLPILTFAIVEMSGKINFEKVNNYLGETVIFYDQEIDENSTKTTSYEVTNMMTCRRIKNATQSLAMPLNLVSVRTLANGTITCKVAFQDVGLLKLSPKNGTITFLDSISDEFSPAKSGIFYSAPYGKTHTFSNSAQYYCLNNWKLAIAITPTQRDELEKFMEAKGITDIVVNATCTTPNSLAYWNDGTPFNYTLADTYWGPWVMYQLYGAGNERFHCIYDTYQYSQVVCMANIYSSPWAEF